MTWVGIIKATRYSGDFIEFLERTYDMRFTMDITGAHYHVSRYGDDQVVTWVGQTPDDYTELCNVVLQVFGTNPAYVALTLETIVRTTRLEFKDVEPELQKDLEDNARRFEAEYAFIYN